MIDARMKLVAKTLAKHFSEENGDPLGPCACLGTECGRLDCVYWWEMMLMDCNKAKLRETFQLLVLVSDKMDRINAIVKHNEGPHPMGSLKE